jgi:S-methylmethionine-dependent homocysteine/selenocysteine methylase
VGGRFITDGGMETTLIFHQGVDLPHFASFVLLEDEEGRRKLLEYFRPYLEVAREQGIGIVLDTPTWRANPDWGAKLGYSPEKLEHIDRAGVELLQELRREAAGDPELVICGCVGPRGDGYEVGETMTVGEAQRYHSPQVHVFAQAEADVVSGLTMTYAEEAAGIALAAADAGIPVVLSFTVETDGRLPSGQALREAIEQVDAETDGVVAYFMVNCAHPTHFVDVLEPPAPWLERIHGVRANASRMSHAELDEADELDEGDPEELAQRYRELHGRLPNLTVVGGCCGTDHRHVGAIASASFAG